MIPEDDDLRQDETSSSSEPAAPGSDSAPPWSAAEDTPESDFGFDQTTPEINPGSAVEPHAEAPGGDFLGENSGAAFDSSGEPVALPGDSSPSDSPIADSDATSPAEASPNSASTDLSPQLAIDRGNEPAAISRAVHRIGSNASGDIVQVNDAATPTPNAPSSAARSQPSADAPADNPRLRRTADGGPPLARPIVLVSLSADELHAVVEAALKLATDRDTRTLNQIAEFKVNSAFFQYKAEQRILNRW